MSKILRSVNRSYQKLKLAESKALTDFGLRVFTHNKKMKNIILKKNISYGTSKYQKFDLMYPMNFDAQNLPIIFYVHGGSWCGGDKYGYTMFCQNLSKLGYVVVNINYRLMPKVSVRTCVADVIKAIRFSTKNLNNILKKEKCKLSANFDKVFLVGDSAGAHIVSLIAAKQTSRKLRLKINITGLGLYYGVYNFENIEHDPSPIMTDLDKYWKSVCGDTKKLYKEISTTTYITPNFPETFMTSGEIDKLHFQSQVFSKLLKRNNIKLHYLNFKKSRQDARHAFLNAPFLKSAKEAFAMLADIFEKLR